jgi:hypothetical protein
MAVDAESLAQIAYAARFPDTGTRYGEMPWDRLPEDAKNKWRRVGAAVGLAALCFGQKSDVEIAWKARALRAEADAERSKQLYYRSDDRAAKAEAALLEIMAAFENPATSEDAAGYIMFGIARTALDRPD